MITEVMVDVARSIRRPFAERPMLDLSFVDAESGATS